MILYCPNCLYPPLQAAKDCIRALLDPDPRTRPTAVEVLQLPWLKQQVRAATCGSTYPFVPPKTHATFVNALAKHPYVRVD